MNTTKYHFDQCREITSVDFSPRPPASNGHLPKPKGTLQSSLPCMTWRPGGPHLFLRNWSLAFFVLSNQTKEDNRVPVTSTSVPHCQLKRVGKEPLRPTAKSNCTPESHQLSCLTICLATGFTEYTFRCLCVYGVEGSWDRVLGNSHLMSQPNQRIATGFAFESANKQISL